ncbi:MAG: signal peptidase I [Verrucomicrobiota bacterium]
MFSNKLHKSAKDLLDYLRKKLRYNRDLLSTKDLEECKNLKKEIETFCKEKPQSQDEQARERMAKLEKRVCKFFPVPKEIGWIENVEVLFVAVVLALALRTHFLQPFKIPTHSMRPTLLGISAQVEEGSKPGAIKQVADILFLGKTYHSVIAKKSGYVESIEERQLFGFMPFFKEMIITIGGVDHRVWGSKIGIEEAYSESDPERFQRLFQVGDEVVNYSVTTGDHIFVNKILYHFRRPELGEVFVFTTKGIRMGKPTLGSQYYIKRCVGTQGDKLHMDPPYLYVNGEKLGSGLENEFIFERIYSQENGYKGYVFADIISGGYLSEGQPQYTVPQKASWAMGDNSPSSSDSRKWGKVPDENLVGTALIVHWPFSERWGFIK